MNLLLIQSKTTCIILTNAFAVHVNLMSSSWRILIDYLEYSSLPLTFWSLAMWLLHCLFMVRHDIEVFQTCHFILPVRLCCLRKICGRLKSQVVLRSGSSIPQNINSKTQSLSLKALTPSSSFQRLLNSYSGSSQSHEL